MIDYDNYLCNMRLQVLKEIEIHIKVFLVIFQVVANFSGQLVVLIFAVQVLRNEIIINTFLSRSRLCHYSVGGA
jgi:hypothetical protein